MEIRVGKVVGGTKAVSTWGVGMSKMEEGGTADQLFSLNFALHQP